MILIPAIDILGGRCVRLLRGDYNQVTEYGSDPTAVARKWQEGGAARLHLVDLDGAKDGRAVNDEIVSAVVESLSIPVEVGGGIRTLAQVDRYLSRGVDRVILGTVAFRDPTLLAEAASAHPGRIYVAIDSKDGHVAVEGWIEETSADAYELADACQKKGAAGIVFTDISRDGTLVGPNLESLKTMVDRVSLPVIASGGISSLDDLRAIRNLHIPQIEGVITGKALYSGAFTIEEAIAVVGG